MRKITLSPGELGRARGIFYLFAVLNVMSFTLLSGNVITLYALRLGAGNFLVGLLSSFMYSAYLFLFLGRRIAPKWGMVRLMGRFWVLRYLMMLPILLSPIVSSRGYPELAYAFIVFSVLGFNTARGIAIAGYNPILGEIAAEKDRGAFVTRLQAVQHSITLALSIAMAVILGRSAPLYVYALFILTGIAAGLIAASVIFRLPEPARADRSVQRHLLKALAQAFAARTFRTFIILYFFSTLLIYMAAPFLVVYFKRAYSQADNVVLYFLVFGSLGAVLMALASGFLIDRIGAKPLYFLFFAVLTLVLIPLVVSPPLDSAEGIWIFACAVLLFFNMGQFGILNAGQVYFLAAIKPEDRLDLGVIFYMTLGIAGALGSILGGTLLEWLQSWLSGAPAVAGRMRDLQTTVFQIYFGAVALFSLVLLFFLNTMENLGAYPILDAVATIFSPRDLRAISLLHRLNKAQSQDEERQTLRALAEAQSGLPLKDILSRMRSPRFAVRAEALQALASVPLDEGAAQALISEVRNHPYTTAYLAAEILGKRNLVQGIPVLRRALHSKDFFLRGKSMLALARLQDRGSIEATRQILGSTTNPRLIIHAALALELYRDREALAALMNKLKTRLQPYVRDEIILSLAGILGFGEWFYPLYSGFLESAGTGISLLEDSIEAAEAPRIPKELLRELLNRLPLGNKALFCGLAAELLQTVEIGEEGSSTAARLSEGVLDRQLITLERFLFLVAAAIVWNACRPGPPARS